MLGRLTNLISPSKRRGRRTLTLLKRMVSLLDCRKQAPETLRTMCLSCPRLVTVVILTSLCIRPALALDPTRLISQYKLDFWQREQGLPQNFVRAMAQSRDGYLWLGTEEGLIRFDGVRFATFNNRNTPEIKHNLVLALCVDRSGRLWIGTSDGLNLYQDGRFTRYTTD